jgi:hypothetical protein
LNSFNIAVADVTYAHQHFSLLQVVLIEMDAAER